MISIKDDHVKTLKQLHSEWMLAEECIKQAEQVNSAVVIPAVKELRYAGRCLINAINLIVTEGSDEKATEYLLDAKFDANRARHDAVDALVSKVSIDLETIVLSTGPVLVKKSIPEFGELVLLLRDVQRKIARSRANPSGRNGIYEDIERDSIEKIIDLVRQIRDAEIVVSAIARKDALRQRIAYFIGASGTLISAICLFIVFSRT